MSDFFKYDLTIIIRNLIKSLGNSTLHVSMSREIVNNLYDSVHFFWCVFQTKIGESIDVLCILMIWESFRWRKTSFVYLFAYNLIISFIAILMTFALLMIDKFDISSLMIRGYVSKTSNVETRSLYSVVSLTTLIIICKRISLMESWSFNSTIMIK